MISDVTEKGVFIFNMNATGIIRVLFPQGPLNTDFMICNGWTTRELNKKNFD